MRILISMPLAMLLLGGCVSQSSRGAVTGSPVRAGDYLLITLTRDGTTGEMRKVVDSAGNISLPFNVTVRAAGMPLDQIGQSITKTYNVLNCFSGPLQVSVSKDSESGFR